jgi:peptidyl-prolyl cis-trans isomerase C
MRRISLIGLITIGFLTLACSAILAEQGSTTQGEKIPLVVARVNGDEITGEQYRDMWHTLHKVRKKLNPAIAVDKAYIESMREEVIERLIALELLSQKAHELNIYLDPKEVESTLQDMRALHMGGSYGLMGAFDIPEPDWENYREDLINSMRIQKLLEQEVYGKCTVTPEELRQYYEAHPEEFRFPEELRARHILIMTPEDATEVQKKGAMEAIHKAAERIRNGEPFEEVAKEVSQDGSASYGGDLGFFRRGNMVPEFEEVAFSLDVGQVSDVVQTRYGYHLIKVEDKKPPPLMPFEEVERELTERLRARKSEARGREYIETIKAESQIEKIPF